MSNTYTQASFAVHVTSAEGKLLENAVKARRILEENHFKDNAEIAEAFAELGPEFAAAFPSSNGGKTAGFLDIFDDPAFPTFGCDIEVNDLPDEGLAIAYFTGENVDVDSTAALIHRVCRSALPFAFEYAFSCDKLKPGEFGGGYAVIDADGVETGGTSTMMSIALRRAELKNDPDGNGADGYVLAVRHDDDGLMFWNRNVGYTDLKGATVFTEVQAQAYNVPFGDDAPEWLAMPAPIGA